MVTKMKFEGKIDDVQFNKIIEGVITEILKEIRKEVEFIQKDIYELKEEVKIINQHISEIVSNVDLNKFEREVIN